MKRGVDFYTIEDVAAIASQCPDCPKSKPAIYRLAEREGWKRNSEKAFQSEGRGGKWKFHISLLPKSVQAHLNVPKLANNAIKIETPNDVWLTYEKLSEKSKQTAQFRLKILNEYGEMVPIMGKTRAGAMIAQKFDVSCAALYRWRDLVQGVSRHDWLAYLAPKREGQSRARVQCHDQLYKMIKSDYLRLDAPVFSKCYYRVRDYAQEHGLKPLPSQQALRRMLNRDVPKDVQVLARKGDDALKALYPAQTRDKTALHAMEICNMDGHKFDVFINIGNQVIKRIFLVAAQDIYSGKILAWRLELSENKDAVRLTIGDMVAKYGIPKHMFLDNGRAFASKWITGGTKNRFRFKVKDEDPDGLLTTLGVDVHWTTPYSGQSKPIERAFLDLSQSISQHPKCSGAYTGNRPENKPANYGEKSVDLADFQALCEQEIDAHNARCERSTQNAVGRSFDDAFFASLEANQDKINKPAPEQAALWLLMAENIKARKGNGEIHLHGNRYWHDAMTQYANENVIIRFDPQQLHQAIRVYDLQNKLICVANCIEAVGFMDTIAARDHSTKRNAYKKAKSAERKAHLDFHAHELAELYLPSHSIGNEAAMTQETPKRDKTVVPLARKRPPKINVDLTDDEIAQANADFSAGLKLIVGGRS